MTHPAPTETPNPAPSKITRGDRQHRYLAQSVVLEEAGLSNLIRAAGLLVSVALAAFFLWAWFSVLDEMATASGEVVPNTPIQSLQHLEGGIIQEIVVKNGDRVRKGQLLLRLDPNIVEPELRQLRARLAGLTLQSARLTAFLEETEPEFGDLPTSLQPLVAEQQRLLASQRQARDSQLQVIDTQIAQRRARLRDLEHQLPPLGVQRDLNAQELDLQEQGLAKGLVSKLTVMGVQRERARLDSEAARLGGEVASVKEELEEFRRRRVETASQLQHEARLELNAALAEAAQLREQIGRLEERLERLAVHSPLEGIVKDLVANTVGGVIPPGGHVADIVPVEQTRHAEIRISPKDVGHVAAGQQVTIKVATFDYARYGAIPGSLLSISPGTFLDEKQQPYYRGLVMLSRNHVGTEPGKNEVLPGMTVQADIHTGQKTMLEYLLKPIYSSISESFRER
ncbi:MAG: HlyD family type I secretion periplasmic adaptor subunit [Magnetococcales bacterium]|nr:HlyD family type I secretion periplasmic adaptor subunit [Magnetococcales bacterium]